MRLNKMLRHARLLAAVAVILPLAKVSSLE